ncbi:hypothetical protein BC831DRAFT_461974, partial [Entophlyctis helioformis]
ACCLRLCLFAGLSACLPDRLPACGIVAVLLCLGGDFEWRDAAVCELTHTACSRLP